MYTERIWQDHVTEFENRYNEVVNPDGSVSHEPIEGEILQQGTPQNAKNFNHMEAGILEANEKALYLALSVLHMGQAVEKLNGEIGTVTLTNTESYPFNNSVKTVALRQTREDIRYRIITEATAQDTGGIGEVIVTDRQTNGFKIRYTGSAKNVTVRYVVEGGAY